MLCRGESVLNAYDGTLQDGPHSPDHGQDMFRTPSYSSGPCSEAPGMDSYPHGGAYPAPRGHLHTTSWPPIGGAQDLNVVRM